MTIEIKGIECENADDALGWIDASGRGVAISIGGKVLVVDQAEADRIAAMGVFFAYLCDHEMPDGTQRIMTVPVND
jgi:hypothetical protein